MEKYKKILLAQGELYLRIKARPGAGVSAIKQILKVADGEIIKLDLAAPAVRNKANLELIKFLAREFAISRNHVKIIGGAGDREKLVKIVN